MFERGFKTWCEKYAAEKRKDLGLVSSDPLDPFKLAKLLRIRVQTPYDVLGLSRQSLDILLKNDGKTPSCWSAVTIVAGDKVVVFLNCSHSPGRRASDLMHELAHRIRNHQAQEVDVSSEGLMLLKNYDKRQEEEADWLSGCLLLPRDALLAIKKRGLALDEAATIFGVSQSMLKYRLAMTGVNRQFPAYS